MPMKRLSLIDRLGLVAISSPVGLRRRRAITMRKKEKTGVVCVC